MKIASYAMAFWLARIFASSSGRAAFLLNSLILIGACYAVYALALASYGFAQFNVFYSLPATTHDLSGPFVNHNSYATYAGLITLCSGVCLFETGAPILAVAKNWRQTSIEMVQFLLGKGLLYLLASLLALSTLIATGSRAGNAASLTAIVALLALAAFSSVRQLNIRWIVGLSVAVVLAIGLLFVLNGNNLASHLNDIDASGIHDDGRLLLWGAAWRMIKDAPLLGLGLGTYENAYPLYSDMMVRFVMDRAHNDYLELAAGLGLPAAILWWSSLGWLAYLCLRGFFARRRNRTYPLLAVGATVLVGLHAMFDFSLQMPAIALTYAVILGVGVAQAFPSRSGV